jgi:TrmH family RNA methyltransferase
VDKFRLIDSPKNPKVKHVADIRDRKSRRGGEFMVEGPHLVESALDAGAEIKQAFFNGAQHKVLLKRIARTGAEIFEVSGRVLSKLTGTETPQGILAIVSLKTSTFEDIDVTKGPVVVLDGVQDPGNVGTIIRTADAAGASAVVVLQGTADAFSQKALRSSSGSIFNIKIVRAQRKTVSDELKKLGLRILATTLDAETSIFDANLSGPLALVFGNETKGVSLELRRAADLAVKIPVHGGAESLNVASSAAIALYEVMRKERG